MQAVKLGTNYIANTA